MGSPRSGELITTYCRCGQDSSRARAPAVSRWPLATPQPESAPSLLWRQRELSERPSGQHGEVVVGQPSRPTLDQLGSQLRLDVRAFPVNGDVQLYKTKRDVTKSGIASALPRVFAWSHIRRIINVNPALESPTGSGSTMRRRVLIPSIPQVMRLTQALDTFKPGLGDIRNYPLISNPSSTPAETLIIPGVSTPSPSLPTSWPWLRKVRRPSESTSVMCRTRPTRTSAASA